MKAILVLAAILFSTQSFAKTNEIQISDETKVEIVGLLISNSSQLKLVDEDGKASDKSLSSIIAEHIIDGSYLKEASMIGLSASTVTCTDASAKMVGSQTLECTVVLGNGSFEKKSDRLIGPSDESAYVLQNIKVQRVVVPGAKLKLISTEIKATIAG